jgi:hypothetical protein
MQTSCRAVLLSMVWAMLFSAVATATLTPALPRNRASLDSQGSSSQLRSADAVHESSVVVTTEPKDYYPISSPMFAMYTGLNLASLGGLAALLALLSIPGAGAGRNRAMLFQLQRIRWLPFWNVGRLWIFLWSTNVMIMAFVVFVYVVLRQEPSVDLMAASILWTVLTFTYLSIRLVLFLFAGNGRPARDRPCCPQLRRGASQALQWLRARLP